MMTVANTIDDRISSVASRTMVAAGSRSASGLARFSRSRLTTFSTSTIASSTRSPTAMAIPPSVIVLMPAPKARSASTAAASDSGIAVSVMALARVLARNRRTMNTTSTPPSRSARNMFATATSMKSAWRKIRLSMVMPEGSSCWRVSSSRSSRLVTSIVLAPGCFCTPTMTAGLPLREPSPRLNAPPSLHIRDIPHEHRSIAAQGDDGFTNLLRRAGAADGLEDVLLRSLGEDTCRRILAGAADCG